MISLKKNDQRLRLARTVIELTIFVNNSVEHGNDKLLKRCNRSATDGGVLDALQART